MRYSLILLCVVLLASCKKKPDEPTPSAPATLGSGMLVLNEGLFQHNNASMTWLNTDGTAISDFFEQKTNRGLGDTGNDMERYGNKLYIIVNVSSTIEVLNATTGAAITQINMINGSTPKQPRYIVFKDGKGYISCYDGYVDVLDTATLTIAQRIPVGANPEGMAISNNKLFVANSGGLNFPDVDSTVSVISLTTLSEITRIAVGPNPGQMICDPSGEIYAISRGDYSSVPSRMHRINPITNTKEETFSFDVSSIVPYGNQFFLTSSSLSSSSIVSSLFDPTTETRSNIGFFDLSQVQTPYNIQYRSSTNKFYICDAMGYTVNGFVRVFSASGSLEASYAVGLNPTKIIFYE